MKKHIQSPGVNAHATFGHPRPQMERSWSSLNGVWDWAKDVEGRGRRPSQVRWRTKINVPFAPETPASGVNERGFFKAAWYRRKFSSPTLQKGERLLLHFCAVDYQATVWVNGKLVATHEGGYTPFAADITDIKPRSGVYTIVVRAEDNPHDMHKPRGKQDWLAKPHGIWYDRTSGIWQPVWYEVVPATHVSALRWSCDTEQWQILLEAQAEGETNGCTLEVFLSRDGKSIASQSIALNDGKATTSIALPVPSTEEERQSMQWHPDHPTLFDATIKVRDSKGKPVDTVKSYTAMRSVQLRDTQLLLNGENCVLRMALDQGYWAQSGLTAPDDEALRRDIELAKEMGFNGVRKHQKVENPRFLYWADKLGLMVWEEMPSAYEFSQIAVQRLTRQWLEVLARDYSHPCIVAWVPFNESWGLPDLPGSVAQRDYVRGICQLTRALDPSRPTISNSGWEAAGGEIVTIHDYDGNPQTFAERYADTAEAFDKLLTEFRPAGKLLVVDGASARGKPILVDEFGGVRFAPEIEAGDDSWGYSWAQTPEELALKYKQLVSPLLANSKIAGYCWTQLTDTYQEMNGLLFMDRTPKLDLDLVRRVNEQKG